jgi:hypothetical protein
VIEQVRDLELVAARWDQLVHDAEGIGPQEVHPDRDEVALGLGWLLFEADDVAIRVEFRDSEALRIRYLVQHRPGSPRPGLELFGDLRQRGTEQHVVAEDAAECLVADEVAGQTDGVGDPQRSALISVCEIQPEVLAVREQLDHVTDALAADYDHDFPDPHARERGDRVVDHRPVVDRQQMLVGDDGERKEAGGRAARQHETLQHGSVGILGESVAGSARASSWRLVRWRRDDAGRG